MNNDYQKKVLGDEYIAGADGDRCELERKLKKEKKKCKKLSKELQHTKGGKKLKKKLKRKIKKKNERIKQLERKLEAQEIAISCCKSNVWKETYCQMPARRFKSRRKPAADPSCEKIRWFVRSFISV